MNFWFICYSSSKVLDFVNESDEGELSQTISMQKSYYRDTPRMDVTDKYQICDHKSLKAFEYTRNGSTIDDQEDGRAVCEDSIHNSDYFETCFTTKSKICFLYCNPPISFSFSNLE